MAMMMTGRVLLVCALCVLWCGLSGVAADGAGVVSDGSADEDLLLQWRAWLRRECAEEVGRRTEGRENASAVEECLRQGMDGVRAVVDGRRRWRRQRIAVAAADGSFENDSTPESSLQDQIGSGAGLMGGQRLEPSLRSDTGISDKATAEEETLTRPPEAPELVKNRTEEILNDQEKEKEKKKSAEEGNEDEVNDNGEDDNASTESSGDDYDDEEEEADLEAGTNQKEGRDGGDVDGDNSLDDHAIVQLAAPVDVERQERSLTLNNGGAGGKGGAGETRVPEGAGSQGAEKESAKLTHETGADLMETEDLKEGADQTDAGKQQAIDEAKSNEVAPPATREEMKKEAPKEAKKATANEDVIRKETTEKGKNGAERGKGESSDKAGKEEKENDERRVEKANNEPQDGSETANTDVVLTVGEAAPQTAKPVTVAQLNDTKTTGDSDGSTAVSHTTSPLLLLLVVACAAAAAAVVAA
ncbi:mucin-associated surface protein (MASP) [Trypanosoma cruzi Dm28c]|uniref:Mucin-associated surface protein (MASP) n=2 Tax=Trypanosoma cruzi TaxID=5693 RepID=V5A4K2_TRYCR|nr:mucin-associated surface protein (MASP) [Trypanosoma cruzi Dm28c]PBJ70090.1 mucin-associated surface protein [Trypanosoma cruzi cruzi]PWU84968.1 Mucin-associated surface protein (MASP) [Trypanosoma cruzi]